MNDESNIRPRNDFCLIRVKAVDMIGGLAVPQRSAEGKEFRVVAVGPKVEGLSPGERVLMTGQEGTDWSFIPGHKGLLAIREGNVILVFGEEPAADKGAIELPAAEEIEKDGELKADWSPDSLLYEYGGRLYEVSRTGSDPAKVFEYQGKAP